MIIVKSNGGQLCNKLWSYTALISHSLKFNEKIYIVDFVEYVSLFSNLSYFSNIHFLNSKYSKRFLKLILIILKKTRQLKEFDVNKKTNGISSVCGWKYRSERIYLEEHKNSIRKLFTPKSDVVRRCNEVVNVVKNNRYLVGVHIRRGDYKNFLNGVYYFENEIYKNYMNMISLVLKKMSKKDVCFVICSEDKIDLIDFSELDCFQLPFSTIMDDLYCLSLCDYIIGPPSTFTMWASFYGKVPLRILKYKDENILISQFKPITTIDTFEDGSIFIHDTN